MLKRIGKFTQPYFETNGKEGESYHLVGYIDDRKVVFPNEFSSLKETRMFINKYVKNHPEWLNVNGDISEYNVMPNREGYPDKWHGNVVNAVYKGYTDFKYWEK